MKSLAILIITLLLSSCSEDKSIDLSGRITYKDLDGSIKNAVQSRIAIYKPKSLDPTVLKININAPEIGMPLIQKNSFLHRDPKEAVFYSDFTDSDGNYKINNITSGVYNLVVEKDGFGVIYDLEVDIQKGLEKDFVLVKQDTLFGTISKDSVLTANKSFYLSGTFEIENGAKLVIEEGCKFEAKKSSKIVADDGSSIEFKGSDANPIRFYSQNWDDKWNGIVLKDESSANIEYTFLSGSFPLTISSGSNAIVTNSSFSNMSGVISINTNGSATLEKSLLFEEIDVSETIKIEPSASADISKCIISNSFDDAFSILLLNSSATLNFKKNTLINSSGGIQFTGNNTEISQNLFYNTGFKSSGELGQVAIQQHGGSAGALITKNNFIQNRVNIFTTFNAAPEIFENNFYPHNLLEWNILMASGVHEGTFIGDADYSAINNYWGGSAPSLIKDVNTAGADPRTGEVSVTPYSSVEIQNGAPFLE